MIGFSRLLCLILSRRFFFSLFLSDTTKWPAKSPSVFFSFSVLMCGWAASLSCCKIYFVWGVKGSVHPNHRETYCHGSLVVRNHADYILSSSLYSVKQQKSFENILLNKGEIMIYYMMRSAWFTWSLKHDDVQQV